MSKAVSSYKFGVWAVDSRLTSHGYLQFIKGKAERLCQRCWTRQSEHTRIKWSLHKVVHEFFHYVNASQW